MDRAFEKLIISALKEKRNELQDQLVEIAEVLEQFERKKEPLRIRDDQDLTVAQEKVFGALSVKWKTAEQVGHRVGMRRPATARTLNNLVETAGLGVESQTINGVTMYRRTLTEMRLVAGEGQLL